LTDASFFEPAPKNLTTAQRGDIDTFDFLVRSQVSVDTYHSMQERFILKKNHTSLPSLKQLRTRMLALSGFKPRDYDCCVETCVCFSGPLANLTACPECNAPRKNAAGAPQNTFSYLSAIEQLRALYSCPETAEKMLYRHRYKPDNSIMEDIMDGDRYNKMRRTHVTIDGTKQPYKFFEDEREIALGLSADGMCPFKRRKKSCWPLILINYNLPPEERNLLSNLICVGVIPGPKSPKNLSSFLWPLIEELLELAAGTPCIDTRNGVIFALRAHLIAIFGDIPAITKFLEFIGHNGRYPCRFCLMLAIQGLTAGGGTHLYCPLHRSDGPSVDPLNLPIRTHQDSIRTGIEVLKAPSENARSNLATESGIKGVSLLARLPSVSIPASFPIDIMHLVWINLIPQLVQLWTGDFKKLDNGTENYMFHPTVWMSLGKKVRDSGATIPASFGCRIPDISGPGNVTAEAWSIFATQLAPSLLRQRFRKTTYYTHFVRLILLLEKCTSFSMPRSEIAVLRAGFAQWVQEYERWVYAPHFMSIKLRICNFTTGSTTSTMITECRHAQLTSIICCTSLIRSNILGRFGVIGRSPWSVFVALLEPQSRVAGILGQTSHDAFGMSLSCRLFAICTASTES
jgi:hypothetical protein